MQHTLTASEPLVSVIIPTKNSEQYLARTLKSIRAQTYRNIEVIVVDNYSDDATRDIANDSGAKTVLCGPERSAQLNKAIELAKGRYVYRVDCDFVLDPGLIAECVSVCESGRADAVAVFNGSDAANGFWARVRRFEREMYRNDGLVVGARFVNAQRLRDIGGFDTSLTAGEDYDLHNRLVARGARIAFSSAGELHLGEPKSLYEIWSKNYYYGRTLGAYIKKHPARALRQFSPLRGAYLRNGKRFARHPFLGVALVVMLFTKYLAAAVGALRAFIESKLQTGKGNP